MLYFTPFQSVCTKKLEEQPSQEKSCGGHSNGMPAAGVRPRILTINVAWTYHVILETSNITPVFYNITTVLQMLQE